MNFLIGFVMKFFAQVAFNYLKFLSQRSDIKAAERARLYLKGQQAVIRGLEYKASHPINLPDDPTGDFEVKK